MEELAKKFDRNCKTNGIITRPLANHGLWLSCLLFLSYLQTILRNPHMIQYHYKIVTILLLGMTLQSLEIFCGIVFNQRFYFKPLPAVITAGLLRYKLEEEILFCALTGCVIMIIYSFVLMKLLRSMPKSFTYGEACIVTQGLIIFLYNCFLQLPHIATATASIEQLKLILQLGVLGVLFIIVVLHYLPFLRRFYFFYPLLMIVCTTLCLTTINRHFAITILWNFIFKDFERTILVGAYVALLALAVVTVSWQIHRSKKSSTATRKIFHMLIVMVYVPGLLYQCSFLYIASVVIFAFLTILEVARVIKLYPVAEILDTSVAQFIDEKDAGGVALTPLYLLVGCSLPMWIHNTPCDLFDSCSHEFLPLLSGIISIGIGDSFASAVGSKFGRHKWSNSSNKSVEGTIASIFGQLLFIYALNYFEFLNLNLRMAEICGIAVITNALIEAFTDQVDNLVLPIVTYAILAMR